MIEASAPGGEAVRSGATAGVWALASGTAHGEAARTSAATMSIRMSISFTDISLRKDPLTA
jgi:hypothetical protein